MNKHIKTPTGRTSKASTPRTSWSDKELEKLCNIDNHKITYDRYQFRWYHNIKGKWEIHSLMCFEDYKKPYSWLMYHLAKWNEELVSRRRRRARIVKRRQIRIEKISKEREFDNARKALEIHNIMSELTNAEIGNILGVSKQMIGRYLKAA